MTPDRNYDGNRSTGADAAGLPRGWTPPATGRPQRVLYFTRTTGFEHSAVHRNGNGLSHSEAVLLDMARRIGIDVECSKDGRVFDGDLDRFDAFAFYTLGDLLLTRGYCQTPPMSLSGKQRLLDAVAGGKGFVGFHAASDTFYGSGLDPYIEMVGAEFCGHGPEQPGRMRRTSPSFPGLDGLDESLEFFEEWYAFKKVSRRMHVIFALDTAGMKSNLYARPPMPATWARMYGKGRVFFTSLGHREEVWLDPRFQQIAYAGLAWSLKNVDADITSNFDQATPEGDRYRKLPLEPGCVAR
jgi:type 1 glutamine amidotransferase